MFRPLTSGLLAGRYHRNHQAPVGEDEPQSQSPGSRSHSASNNEIDSSRRSRSSSRRRVLFSSRRSSRQTNSSSNMGNIPSHESCTSGKESAKDDLFTVVPASPDDDIQQQHKKSSHHKHHHSPSRRHARNGSHTSAAAPPPASPVMTPEDKHGSSSSRRPSLVSPHTHHKHHRLSSNKLRSLRKGGQHMFHKMGHSIRHRFHAAEQFLFPHAPTLGSSAIVGSHNKAPVNIVPRVRGGVLLRGCHTDDEHKALVKRRLQELKALKGADGLRLVGLEYRTVPLDYVDKPQTKTKEQDRNVMVGPDDLDLTDEEEEDPEADSAENNHNDHSTKSEAEAEPEPALLVEETRISSSKKDDDSDDKRLQQDIDGPDSLETPAKQPQHHHGASAAEAWQTRIRSCHKTQMTRLFHIQSNTMLTEANRKEFIADGDMYDAVARCAQEYAQEIMMEEGNLEWVTVCEAGNNPEPIRALVSTDISINDKMLDQKPTLLIATGKGKVRAGVFSRQHLLLSGVECSTALPLVREAIKRNMNVVMVDPNVHGDRLGMVTFEKSMAKVFSRWEQEEEQEPSLEHTAGSDEVVSPGSPFSSRDLYILSHSQSGAQLARYLLDKSEKYLPHIRAVAFTDSTHNIQWARENDGLQTLLQSESCVYFKVSKEHSKERLQPLPSVGEPVETDTFWEHRFGKIKTLCSGTSEHSLTNWFVLGHIWDHFDNFRSKNHNKTNSNVKMKEISEEERDELAIDEL